MFLILALLACGPKPAPVAAGAGGVPELSAEVPVDPLVRRGTLDNGLQWMVEENRRPEQRAELRLVLRVGSLAEDDDQRGLAHFLEHMAFNGTENYPGRALIDTIEGFGMEFGPHLNAYTSFEETVYQLQVPTDDPATVREALRILRDQAGGMLLDPKEIELERGVVLEEWRSDKGPDERIYQQTFQESMAGSRYADRDVIGTEESLRTFAPEALRRFYADWYRPDLMAVLVVGDLEAGVVSAAIAEIFGDLQGPEAPRALPDNRIPPHAPRVQVVTDPGADGSWWMLSDQRDRPRGTTHGDYRNWVKREVLETLLSRRLRDIPREPDSAVLGADAGESRTNRIEVEDVLYADAVVGRELAALERVALAARQVRVHGFTDAEIELARAAVSQSYAEYYDTRGTSESSAAIEELVRHFADGEIMPGTVAEVELAQLWLPTLTAEELNAAAAQWLQQGSALVQLVMPEQEGTAVPTEAEIQAVLESVEAMAVEAPVSAVAVTQLMDPPAESQAAQVVTRRRADGLGVDILELSNGMELWLKPTDFEDDVVVLHASSLGGRSLVPDARVEEARMALGIAARSGLGALDAPQLMDFLSQHRVESSLVMGNDSEGLWASGPPSQLELMLQLVSLQMTESRATEDGLALYKRQMAEGISSWERSVEHSFDVAMQEAFWVAGPRTAMWTTAVLEHASIAGTQRVVSERFGNAADFRWFLVGDFAPSEIEPLLLRYLGALPTAPEREAIGPHREALRFETVSEVVYAGTEPKADVMRSWIGPFSGPSWLRRNRFNAMQNILALRAEQTLREELGGVYGVSIDAGVQTWPEDHFVLSVHFSCDPARVDELLAALNAEVEAMVAAPPTEEEIRTQQRQSRRGRETALKTNEFWPASIFGALRRGEDPADLLTYGERVDQLSPAAVHEMAQEIFTPQTATVQVVRRPAAQAPDAE